MSISITLLGTGTSHGVPMIGCECAVCRSTDPRDRRSRPSILIRLPDDADAPPSAAAVRSILVDTSTDLRAQALERGVTRVDAVLFTHSHADHVMGLDEIRRFNVLQRHPMPCFGDAHTLSELRQTFRYVFDAAKEQGGGVPQLAVFPIAGPFSLGGVEVVPVPIVHGRRLILGYRIGTFAYLTDCSAIPDTSWPLLDGRQDARPRRAARPAAPDAFQRVRSPGRGGAALARPGLLHAHLPRSAARGHLRAPAPRRGVGL